MEIQPLLQHRQQQTHPVVIHTGGGTPRHGQLTSGHQGLNLQQDGPRALHGAGHNRTGRLLGATIQHKLRRVLNFRQARLPHFKDADLIGRSETVLHSPQDSIGCMPVALEVQHRIHHMLQHTGTRHRTFLGHMAHDENGNAQALGQLHQH